MLRVALRRPLGANGALLPRSVGRRFSMALRRRPAPGICQPRGVLMQRGFAVGRAGGRRSWRLLAGYLGVGAVLATAHVTRDLWPEELRRLLGLAADDEAEREKEARDKEAHDKEREAEVARLVSQVSWRRLVSIVLTMLPVVFAWPLWLLRPSTFWSFVVMRVDYCGPCFVKLAQWLATRRDIFPEEVCTAFSGLHNQVAASWSAGVSSTEVEAMLKEHDVALRSIEPQAYASGSIAEVFFATLADGTDVAVKCLRPGARALLEADLGWLLLLSGWAHQFRTLRLLGLREAAEDFVEHVQMQTDFEIEASHLRRFRANFSGSDEAVRFPKPLHVTPETLVLSRETGRELAHVLSEQHDAPASPTKAAGVPMQLSKQERKQVASTSMSSYMRMVFEDHFVHGDLHPGNIMLHLELETANVANTDRKAETQGVVDQLRSFVRAASSGSAGKAGRDFELVILDAGLAIPLPQDKVEVLRSLAISIVYSDFARAAEILYNQSPDKSRCWDAASFKSNMAAAFRDCRKDIWEEGRVQVSDTCLRALHLVQHYNVGLDVTLTWALFGMLSVEGSARQLDPNVDCARAAMRYVITVPSLLKEMRCQSRETIRHMVAELICQTVGLDYWDIRHQFGWTWALQD